MRNHLVPVLLVLVLPALYLAWRLGWTGGAFLRYLWLAALIVGVWLSCRRCDGSCGRC
ncbi:MAG: hypothetical protein V3T72_20845 [Thermoanaerobaculia bacterium]